ncbi:MAG: hypothetical protein LH609_11155 [Rudanella sp.]|nr:hypothetical protein [Rudanella sp.]
MVNQEQQVTQQRENSSPAAGGSTDCRVDRLWPNGKMPTAPVGVTMLPDGSMLVADDSGNRIWRVAAR